MKITSSLVNLDSEREFRQRFFLLADAGSGIIHVRAQEVVRATTALRKAIVIDGSPCFEWDIVNGVRQFNGENFMQESTKGDDNIDFSNAFGQVMKHVSGTAPAPEQKVYYVFVSPERFMENNPLVTHLMNIYNDFLPLRGVTVVILTHDAPLPEDCGGHSVLTAGLSTPGYHELRKSLDDILEDNAEGFQNGIGISDEERQRICYAGAGMSLTQFEAYVSLGLAMSKATGDEDEPLGCETIEQQVRVGKTDIVNSNDLLELYPTLSIDEVGGMDNLKSWVRKRAKCYSDEAKDYGIEPPKGIVLVGPPGTGKSLVGKAISSVLGIPIVRMDFGKVFSSLVGSSEQRIRTALKMVEAMAPVVLFCDELDKGLGGIAGGSGGDSGVSMRVLGSFLTWLQDCKHPVFTMVTANNVDGLPAELLRRGRFDAIFSTTLPDAEERRDVLAIHLHKRGRSIDELDKEGVASVLAASEGYVPAELESAVKDALIEAFSDDRELSADDILDALKAMVPMSRAFKTQIDKMNEWAKNNATPVSIKREAKKTETGATPRLRPARVSSRKREA